MRYWYGDVLCVSLVRYWYGDVLCVSLVRYWYGDVLCVSLVCYWYSQTSLIRTPVIRAPPSTGQLICPILC